MSRRRYDTTGIALPDDATPELPLAIRGLIEPHALMRQLHWHEGLPPQVSGIAPDGAADPALASDEIPSAELVDEDSFPPAVRAPAVEPPAPPPPRVRGADRSDEAEFELLTSGDLPRFRPPPPPATRITGVRKKKAPAGGVDDLMSEILAAEDRPKQRRTSASWWSEVFDETYLRMAPPTEPRRTLRELAFLVAALELQPGARVLDVGCGAGRHVVGLAAAGCSVTGVDISRELLEQAFEAAEQRGVETELLLADMREMTFDGQFDAAFTWQTSFGYFDDATNLRVLTSMCRGLRPGGLLAIDQINRDHVVPRCPRRLWWERERMIIMEDITFDHAASRLVVERQIADEGGAPWEQTISIRLYSPHELIAMARAAGLEPISVSGDIAHQGAYVGAENRSAILVARKPR